MSGLMPEGKPFPMIAKTVQGLEEELAAELVDLGAQDVIILNRAVGFSGDKKLLYQANYCCRLALRILVPYRRFRAGSEDELYFRAKEIDWPSLFGVDQTFAIDSVTSNSNFSHSQYVSQLVKDAIADRFREKGGRRPSVDLDQPDIRINVHISGAECSLSFDSSGTSLHKRGYRVMTHDAPLNEVLAAGMIRKSGWDKHSHFVDPMCGSGTLLIEALMLATATPAGFYHGNFCFFNWKDFDKTLWENIKAEAAVSINREIDFRVFGNDLSRKSIYQARENLEKAGFDNMVRLTQGDFKRFDPPEAPAILITNPPYGERIQVEDITTLYQELGNTLKRKYPGYKAWVLSADIQALKMIGLKPFRRIPLFNGPLECRFFGFDLYAGSKKDRYTDGSELIN